MMDVLLGVVAFVAVIAYAVWTWTQGDGPVPPYPLFGVYWKRGYKPDAEPWWYGRRSVVEWTENGERRRAYGRLVGFDD